MSNSISVDVPMSGKSRAKINDPAKIKDNIVDAYKSQIDSDVVDKKSPNKKKIVQEVSIDIKNKENNEEENVVMGSNKDVLILGIGQCGANIAHCANKKGFTTCAVNTSEEDIKHCTVDEKFIFEDVKGSGKERERSKSTFVDNADKLYDFIISKFDNIQTYIIVCSAAGGTGGGVVPAACGFALGLASASVIGASGVGLPQCGQYFTPSGMGCPQLLHIWLTGQCVF